MARPEKVRLGEILVQQKLLTEEQLGQALTEQKRSGRKLGRVFVEHGFVTEEQISGALARQLDIPYINLKFFNINPDLVRLAGNPGAALSCAGAGRPARGLAGRYVRSHRPVRVR